MKMFKLSLLLGLLLCSATFITSCKDDPEWQPTWAVPLVKETALTVGEFVTEDNVVEFSSKIKEYWDDYTAEQLAVLGPQGQDNIDSVAYSVLTDPTLGYVTHPTDNTAPQLTPEAEQELMANSGLNQSQIDEINQFLAGYYSSGHVHSSAKATTKALRAASPMSSKTAIDNLLDGITNDPKNVFNAVGGLLSAMPGYKDSINNQLEEVLKKASLYDSIAISLRDFVKNAQDVVQIKVDMDVVNTLPFDVRFHVNFVDEKGDSVQTVFNQTLASTLGGASSQKLRLPSFDLNSTKNASALVNVFNKTQSVKMMVDIRKPNGATLSAEDIKTLGSKGIRFDMRVKIKAQMSDLLKGL